MCVDTHACLFGNYRTTLILNWSSPSTFLRVALVHCYTCLGWPLVPCCTCWGGPFFTIASVDDGTACSLLYLLMMGPHVHCCTCWVWGLCLMLHLLRKGPGSLLLLLRMELFSHCCVWQAVWTGRFWGLSCLLFPCHWRDAWIIGACYCAQLYMGSGDLK